MVNSNDDLFQGFLIGAIFASLILGFLFALIGKTIIKEHKEQLIELGVGEYYLDEDDKRQFRILEPKQ